MIKKISAIAAAAVIAATMSISAFATNNEDAVQAAKDAGVPATNVQELSNFLEPNKDKFTSAQYDDMIATLNKVRDDYVAPKAQSMFNKTPAQLTEDEKTQIRNSWTKEEKQAIANTLTALGEKYGVTVDIAGGTVGATVKSDSKDSSKGTGTQTKTDSPVAATGNETTSSNAAAAAAAVTLAMAGIGVVVVAKKNRA